LIRSLLKPTNYVIVVEHDLSVLDYLVHTRRVLCLKQLLTCSQSDFVCLLYGKPAVYGVVTQPYSVREGINVFLDGHIPTENLRFREESLQFRIGEAGEEFLTDKSRQYGYPSMTKSLGEFNLTIEAGTFTDSEIIVMMGENGTGKTTYVLPNSRERH